MKKKYICTAGASLLLLLLFLPVFFKIIFYGTNLNYNEMHKIITVQGNKVLLLCAIIGAGIIGMIYYLLRKIPYTKRTVRYFMIGTLIICILLYLFNSKVSKCIAFYGGWDCGMVANSAHWIFDGGDLGYDNYYTIYTNNIPITWLLYKLYSFSSGLTNYPYNPEFIWIQYQCIMLSLAVFFSVLFVLRISKKIGTSAIALLMQCIFLGLSPWKIIPYTDGCTIAVPIMIVSLYALCRPNKRKRNGLIWFGITMLGCLGGIMKATCYVALIAVILVDVLWTLLDDQSFRTKLCGIGLKFVLIIMAFFLGNLWKQGMYRELNYTYDADMEIGWSNYMYNGLNEETTGACSGEGLEIVYNFAGSSKADRIQYEIDGIKKRLQDRGIEGTLNFWLRKQVMNFNDGTFSWYQEGYFQAWEYPDQTESSWKEPLRSFYWQDGENYIWFTTLSQGIWLFALVGIIVEAFLLLADAICNISKKETEKNGSIFDYEKNVTLLNVIFIGMFLFVMLFEARARYLYNFIPVFSVMAVLGYCKLYQKFILFFDKKRN